MTRDNAWFRQPAMLVVAGVLTFTLLSGSATLAFSLSQRDALLMSAEDYRAWRDDMRATGQAGPSPANSQTTPSDD